MADWQYDSFVPARWFHEGRQGKAVRLIVIHDAEYPEKPTGAEDVAAYFAHVDHKASAHAVADCDTTVGCVADENTAFHAPGANNDGWGLELVGYAKQATADWLDDYGVRMFRDQAGPLCRSKAAKFGIPTRWLTVAEVADGVTKGFCTHADVTAAFHQSTHTDPGGNFPRAEFMQYVIGATPALAPTEDEMFIYTIQGNGARMLFTGAIVVDCGDTNFYNELRAAGVRDVGKRNGAFHNYCVDITEGQHRAGRV